MFIDSGSRFATMSSRPPRRSVGVESPLAEL
jgi:hypothetical protein